MLNRILGLTLAVVAAVVSSPGTFAQTAGTGVAKSHTASSASGPVRSLAAIAARA